MSKAEFKKFIKYYADSDYRKAYSTLRAMGEQYRESGEFYALWAELEVRVNKNFSRADYLLGEAKHLGCSDDFYHSTCGYLFLAQGQIPEAISEYELAVEAEPSVGNWKGLAESLYSMGDKDSMGRSKDIFKDILRKDRKDVLALCCLARAAGDEGDIDKAVKLLGRAQKIEPRNPEALYGIGDSYFSLEQYAKAIDYYFKAEEYGYEEKDSIYANVAGCYGNIDNHLDAIKYARKAIEINPEDESNREILDYCKHNAFFLATTSRIIEAYPIMKIAMEIWPDDSLVLAHMSVLEIDVNRDFELAKAYMKKAFQCNNADLDELYQMKGLMWSNKLGEKEEGLALLEKAVSLNPNMCNLLALAGEIMETDHKRTKEILDGLAKSHPNDIEVLRYLSGFAIEEDRNTEALEIISQAYEQCPDDLDVIIGMGLAHFHLDHFKEALAFYKKADELGFGYKIYLYNAIAECWLKLGEPVKARSFLQKAEEIDPEDEDLKRLRSEFRGP